MKLAVMQPYFLPYLGYFQLINAVDKFVIYDNIQYTKKGWFNRNRYLKNAQAEIFTIPLKKDSDYIDVNKRFISETFDKRKLLSQFQNAYSKAPYNKEVMMLLKNIIEYEENNLFNYIYHSVVLVMDYLAIKTPLVISSQINCNHMLKGKDRVIEICKSQKADTYINPIGGVELYDKEEFKHNSLDLKFLKMDEIKYCQTCTEFVKNLSVIDVLMFNSKNKIVDMLEEYKLV